MDLIPQAVFSDLRFCQPIQAHRLQQGKVALQTTKCWPVSGVEQNLDLVTGFVENAGRTLNVSRVSVNELQYANRFLFKCVTEGQDRIQTVLYWARRFFLQSFCVVHTSLCDYKKGLFIEN